MNDHGTARDPQTWREVYSTNPGDYYADTISVSDEGMIRLSAGGKVVGQKSVRAVVDAMWPDEPAASLHAGTPPPSARDQALAVELQTGWNLLSEDQRSPRLLEVIDTLLAGTPPPLKYFGRLILDEGTAHERSVTSTFIHASDAGTPPPAAPPPPEKEK